MGLLLGCACGLVALFVVLLIYAVVLRASVWITNKCLGESGGSGGYNRQSSYEDDWDDDYERPARRRGTGIPEPNLGKGMGISFRSCLISEADILSLGRIGY